MPCLVDKALTEPTPLPLGHFPALASLDIQDPTWSPAVAAAVVKGLDAHSRAVKYLWLGRDYIPVPQTESYGIELVEALAAAGERDGGPFDKLTSLGLNWAGLSYSSCTRLFDLLLGPEDSDTPPVLPFPSLRTLSLRKALHVSNVTDHAWELGQLVRALLDGSLRSLDLSDNSAPKHQIRNAIESLRTQVPLLSPPVNKQAPLSVNLAQWRGPRWSHLSAAFHEIGPEQWSSEDSFALTASWPAGCKIIIEHPWKRR